MLGFPIGAILSTLLLAGPLSPILASADPGEREPLPDIERIYHDPLVLPPLEAERGIEDEDIAKLYRRLLQTTGLDTPWQEQSSIGGSDPASILVR
jgi:hypothetical protein